MGNRDGKGFTCVLVKHRQHLVGPTIAELVVHKINRPDMVREVRPEPDDGSIVVVETFAALMPGGQL